MNRLAVVLSLFLPCMAGAQVVDRLPDMTVDPSFLEDTDIVTNIERGRVHLRLSNGTPNVGSGPMYVYGVLPANDDGSQDVMQRIFRSDGSHFDRQAGRFVFHPEHNHIHVEDWATYRIREILPNGEAGEVLAESEKTSYCLRDSARFDATLPGAPRQPQFLKCDETFQGISVGYQDIYIKELPDQWIDVTDLPSGEYWLESEVDPDDHFLESDETNNVVRVHVTITQPDSPSNGILDFIRALLQLILDWLRAILGLTDEKAACPCDL